MSVYTIIGTVPQPHYNAAMPVFDHDPSTDTMESHPNGEADHLIAVTTDNENVAASLVNVFSGVFDEVVLYKDGERA